MGFGIVWYEYDVILLFFLFFEKNFFLVNFWSLWILKVGGVLCLVLWLGFGMVGLGEIIERVIFWVL